MAHLDLGGNLIEAAGVERIAGVLPQFTAPTHLDVNDNNIHSPGEERLAGVLGSEQRCLVWNSNAMVSAIPGQRVLQE